MPPGAHPSAVVVLFTRDLRLHDHPALTAALQSADRVVPLFVLDDTVLGAFGAPNRVAFLLESLVVLRDALRTRGSDVVLRRGDAVEQTLRVALAHGAERVHLSEDVSGFARARLERLTRAAAGERIEVRAVPRRHGRAAGRSLPRRRHRAVSRLHAVLEPLAHDASTVRPSRTGLCSSGRLERSRPDPRGLRARSRRPGAGPPARRRARGQVATDTLASGRARRLRRPARRSRRRRNVGALAVPPLRLPLGARGRRACVVGAWWRGLRPPALLARLPPPAARVRPGDLHARPTHAR